ncbi:unnamed protein product [Bursaphelenchus xylophilus]|uniref:(pine wood nematode) hypothetical protein n=1 Tax=Bursaphelenchus xylophilus TaxID=6326 RepID=A0A1I7SS80_BURXY|nr:unnamed protein product [Bursaphelenchus xylophilus]CAG9097950.1 unnamed protein product [Bursaphelenchus xylophilus]
MDCDRGDIALKGRKLGLPRIHPDFHGAVALVAVDPVATQVTRECNVARENHGKKAAAKEDSRPQLRLAPRICIYPD